MIKKFQKGIIKVYQIAFQIKCPSCEQYVSKSEYNRLSRQCIDCGWEEVWMNQDDELHHVVVGENVVPFHPRKRK